MTIEGATTDRRMRCGRARLLGAVAVLVVAAETAWATGALCTTYVVQSHRAILRTIDAAPLVIRGALVIVSLWALLLLLLSMQTLRRSAQTAAGDGPSTVPGGLVGRIALVLLAATMTSTATAGIAPASATTVARSAADRAPVPGFGAPDRMVLATTLDPSFSTVNCTRTDGAPEPGWTASAPSPSHHRGAASAPLVTGCAGSTQDSTEVVVRRGDSLWTLVGRHLHTADPAIIAAQWPRWYAANLVLIGPDPDLLQVGQILHVPGKDAPLSVIPQGDSP